ncbi:MAG: CHASE2 domain-containing protein, partial [bacterium]|nr:CHASE2 domain-containing protein [bacterium]
MALLDLLPRARPRLAAVIALVVFAGLSLARMLGAFEVAELSLYDRDLRAAAQQAVEAPPITLVLIGEDDIHRHGHPLPDETLRVLIEIVLAAGPRALAIDLYRDIPVPPAPSGDPTVTSVAYRRLGEAVTSDPRVVMISKFGGPEGLGIAPPEFLQGSSQVGFADLPLDADGVARRGLLYLWDDEAPVLSISMQLASRYLAAEGIHPGADPDDPEGMLLGATPMPALPANRGPYVRADNAGYQFLLDYRFGDRSFSSLSISEVLAGDFEPEAFRDRVVLLGTAAQSVKDSFPTPIHSVEAAPATYGVEVHAHAVDQLIRYGQGSSRPLDVAAAPVLYGSIALFAIVGAGLGIMGRALWLQAAGMVAVVGVPVVAG